MQAPWISVALSIVLLTSAFTDWSVISALFLVGFLIFHYELKGQVILTGKPRKSLWTCCILAFCTVFVGVFCLILRGIIEEGSEVWNSSTSRVIGLSRLNPSKVGDVILFFLPKLAVGILSWYGLRCRRWTGRGMQDADAFEVRAFLRSFVLPTVQVVAGCIFPSWVAFPYFVCSCAGLFHWSMTRNFFGLSWGWRPLLVYNGLHILLFYSRQLPLGFSTVMVEFVDYIGLFDVSRSDMDWPRILQSLSVLSHYILLCFAIGDMKDFDNGRLPGVQEDLTTYHDDGLYESLLYSPPHARSRRWWIAEQRRIAAFKKVAVCFFAYGFPICLVALVCWSFKFESACAFFLLLYVGIILFTFPSLFLLRRLNAFLLGFILLWALSTYIFNAGFTIMITRFKVDVAMWETIGLVRYSSPGLYLLAQFALGVLVATDLFVGNSIIDNADVIGEDERVAEDGERRERWMLFMAVIAWCLRRSTHVISLVLIFVVALKSGLIHAVYMIFFLVYLLSSSVAKKTRQYLMLYAEVHFSLLYVRQLQWMSAIIKSHESVLKPVLSQLGLWNKATYHDYVPVATLICFCAVQNHGIKVIGSLSAIARQRALRYRPFVLSVYGSQHFDGNMLPSPTENWITRHLAAVAESFRATYRSFGTYIVYATVFLTLYTAEPNYVEFGFLSLLLVWIIGRQAIGKSNRLLWTPLFLYTCVVFVCRYILSVFPDLQAVLSRFFDLNDDLGFDPDASLFLHLWDSLAILAVLQLYRFERSQPSTDENFHSDFSCFNGGYVYLDFVKRLLILHSGKVLSVAVFYASITPVSGFGLLYLVMLVFTCTASKVSALPSQIYAAYSGILIVLEYLFQILGEQGTFRSQLLYWLGLRFYDNGPFGIEAGTRSKALVLLACMLQYCSFQWLDQVPAALRRNGEPCHLFRGSFGRGEGGLRASLMGINRKIEQQASREDIPDVTKISARRSPSLTSRESKKWSRRALILKHEKYAAQWQALYIWGKYHLEHFFTMFGQEIVMLSLLVAAFAVLNIFSLVYVLIIAFCMFLRKEWIRPLWLVFTVLFALILLGEYAVLAKLPPPWDAPSGGAPAPQHCHNCWDNSKSNMKFCWKCWLGMVDDRQALVAYFMVFIITSFQLRANKLRDSASLQWASISATQRLAWAEISYETTGHWTWLDYMRFLFYRRLLHVVLLLVFITGTLQYDLLHLGYLAFSMVFFHIRNTVLNKRNAIFFFLRLYNFGLIVSSLVFQAPAFGFRGRCSAPSIFGLYKYDYGFRITARSALVDITIFCLVGLQSQIFRSKEFEQVLRYLAAEQLEAQAYAHEKKADWKKEQLQRIREIEEKKTQRRLQVDKMKMDMVPLQLHLDVLNSAGKFRQTFPARAPDPEADSLTPSRMVNSHSDSALLDHSENRTNLGAEQTCRRRKLFTDHEGKLPEPRAEALDSEANTERQATVDGNVKLPSADYMQRKTSLKVGLLSGVSLLGDGVAQMHTIGNKALANIVGLLNLENGEADETGSSSADEDEKAETNRATQIHASPTKPETSTAMSETRQRLSMICSYVWSKVIANTDVLCYVLFVLVYVWNFSLLTLVYPVCLFLYALLANPGPSQVFWSIMLFYTELTILLQYMYQTFVNHCGHDELPLWLKKIGIPGRNMNRSFVASVLPLFLVYLATLAQNSIKTREGEWMLVPDSTAFNSRRVYDAENQYSRATEPLLQRIRTSIVNACLASVRFVINCWRSLINGSEVPPHFVQVTLSVSRWPEDGIQPERIETAFNRLLSFVRHGDVSSENKDTSRVRVESLERGVNSSTAFAVLEVIHAAPPLGSSSGKLFTSLTPASDVAAELVKAKQDSLLEQVGFPYPIVSVIAGGRRQIDLYAYVFGTDLIAFLYVALFYQSFIKNSPEFLDVYQLEDQFPKEFVFVLMTLFFLIVFDRGLYLSAWAVGKVFYYLVTLVLYTTYVTNFVWGMELSHDQGGAFSQLLPLRTFYLLKALSLALQALQLRYGIPNKSTLYEQFLTRSISSFNWLGFRIYRALPFLFELRCVLDWSCTTTALSMYDWLKLEDIYASLFLVQCDIKLAREKHRLGQKRSAWLKFGNGICLFFILICVIWAPMLIYSSGNPTNFANQIIEARAEISVRTSGGSFTLYNSQLCQLHSMAEIVTSGFDIDVDNALESFDMKDVQLICCEEDADSLWLISPPTLRTLVRSFDEGVSLVSSWSFRRDRPKGKEIVTFIGQSLSMNKLQGVLNGSRISVSVAELYPRYFRVTSAGEVRVLEQTITNISGNLTLNRDEQTWWSFRRANASAEDGCGGIRGPLAVAVSEEVPKGLIGDTLSKFNIWSLYITFVLAVGRFIRLQCADLRMRIPYENFPSCERLIAICEDIYAARAEGELVLEEGLFWTLIKIYRSPHILLEYTKTE